MRRRFRTAKTQRRSRLCNALESAAGRLTLRSGRAFTPPRPQTLTSDRARGRARVSRWQPTQPIHRRDRRRLPGRSLRCARNQLARRRVQSRLSVAVTAARGPPPLGQSQVLRSEGQAGGCDPGAVRRRRLQGRPHEDRCAADLKSRRVGEPARRKNSSQLPCPREAERNSEVPRVRSTLLRPLLRPWPSPPLEQSSNPARRGKPLGRCPRRAGCSCCINSEAKRQRPIIICYRIGFMWCQPVGQSVRRSHP